jgi:carbon monoxide dehydrogenase subunit G
VTVIEIRKTLDVAAPAARVYAYLVQPANIAEYVGPIRGLDRINTDTLDVGTRLSVEVSFLGIRFRQRVECTEHAPPRRFACRSVGGRFNFTAGFTLHPITRGTTLEGWGEASAPSLFRHAAPILGFFIERQVDRDLARLKVALDAMTEPL